MRRRGLDILTTGIIWVLPCGLKIIDPQSGWLELPNMTKFAITAVRFWYHHFEKQRYCIHIYILIYLFINIEYIYIYIDYTICNHIYIPLTSEFRLSFCVEKKSTLHPPWGSGRWASATCWHQRRGSADEHRYLGWAIKICETELTSSIIFPDKVITESWSLYISFTSLVRWIRWCLDYVWMLPFNQISWLKQFYNRILGELTRQQKQLDSV